LVAAQRHRQRHYRATSERRERAPKLERCFLSAHRCTGRVHRFVMPANTLRACLWLLAKTVGRCRPRRCCKSLMTLYGTRERAALSLSLSLSLSFSLSLCVVAVLSFLEEGRPLSSTTSTTTTTTAMTATTVITTFSLRQLQLEWHRKRQLVSCVRSSAHL